MSLAERVRHLGDAVGGVLKSVVVALTSALLVLVILQVVTRYVFDSPWIWTEEAARYCLVALTFLGAGLLAKEQGHIAVDFFGGRSVKTVDTISKVFQCATATVLVYSAWTYGSFVAGTASPALRMPMEWLYRLVAVGFAVWALAMLAQLLKPHPVPDESTPRSGV